MLKKTPRQSNQSFWNICTTKEKKQKESPRAPPAFDSRRLLVLGSGAPLPVAILRRARSRPRSSCFISHARHGRLSTSHGPKSSVALRIHASKPLVGCTRITTCHVLVFDRLSGFVEHADSVHVNSATFSRCRPRWTPVSVLLNKRAEHRDTG